MTLLFITSPRNIEDRITILVTRTVRRTVVRDYDLEIAGNTYVLGESILLKFRSRSVFDLERLHDSVILLDLDFEINTLRLGERISVVERQTTATSVQNRRSDRSDS